MIERLRTDTVAACYILAEKLWPGLEPAEFMKELINSLSSEKEICYLYVDKGEAVAFVQASIRSDYVEGSESSPVAYVEGIYVEESYRKTGVALLLVKACEAWGKKLGCTEIASDCELENTMSIDFHKGIGFTEANRIVCFIKPLN